MDDKGNGAGAPSDDQQQYMRELYDRFRQQVARGSRPDFFDEDDLLDIYDYAQDEGDAATQFDVLVAAGRSFPDSHAFDERAAFFVSYVSADSALEMSRRRGRLDTPLWDILTLGSRHYDTGTDPSRDLLRLLDGKKRLDCECVIRLMDVLGDLDALHLLVKYYDRLAAQADDLTSLRYEAAQALKECLTPEAMDLSRRLALEITQAEPFDLEGWTLLARAELHLGNLAEAAEAADYAAALDPDDFEANMLRGAILQAQPSQREAALAAYAKARQIDPHSYEPVAAMASLMAQDKDQEPLTTLLEQYFISHPDNFVALERLLQQPVNNPRPYLEMYAAACPVVAADTDTWRDMASRLKELGATVAAIHILLFCQQKNGLDAALTQELMALFYEADLPALVVQTADVYKAKEELSLAAQTLLASALFRLGRNDEARLIVSRLADSPRRSANAVEALSLHGIYDILWNIADCLRNPDKYADEMGTDFILHLPKPQATQPPQGADNQP